jgi:hypothetical protein
VTSTSSPVTDTEWRAHAAALAATVTEALADSAWTQAFAVVPRHVFVPRFFPPRHRRRTGRDRGQQPSATGPVAGRGVLRHRIDHPTRADRSR